MDGGVVVPGARPNALDGTSPAESVGDLDRLLQAADRAAARLQI
jgi:hypothetical protein